MNELLFTNTEIDNLFENCFSMPPYSRIEFLALSQNKSGYSEKTFLNLLFSRWKDYRTQVFSEYEKMGYDKVYQEYGFEFCLKIWGDEPEAFEYYDYTNKEGEAILNYSYFEDENALSNFIKHTQSQVIWLNEEVLFLVRDYIYKLYDYFEEQKPQTKNQENKKTIQNHALIVTEKELNKIPESTLKIISSISLKLADFHLKALNDETYQLPLSIKESQIKEELIRTNLCIVQYCRDNNLILRDTKENVLTSDFISRLLNRMGVYSDYSECMILEEKFWAQNIHIKYGAPNEIDIDLPDFNLLVNYLALILFYDKIMEQNEFKEDLRSNIHQNKIVSNNPQTFSVDRSFGNSFSSDFKYNIDLINKIHDYCNNDIFICSLADFVICFKTADFSLLKIKTISKVKLLIYYLSKSMGSVWYEETAKSLGYEKKACSGANVSDLKWKKQMQKIIPQ